MSWRTGISRACVAATLTVCSGPPQDVPAPAEPFALLREYLGFSASDVRDLMRSRPIRRNLRTTDSREIAVAGAVRVEVPREYFVERFRNITQFRRSPMVLQMGRFSDPPSLADVQELTLGDDDFGDLRNCRPGDCGVKLTADMIRRFREEVKWSSPDERAQANELARQMLVDRARAYLDGGDEALGAYHARKQPVVLSAELAGLLDASPYLTAYAPELRSFLDAYPRIDLQSCEDFLYWSKDAFGLKPIVSLTHVSIFTTQRGAQAVTVIASINLYSSHYLDGSLSLTVAVDAPEEPRPAVYLVYINRSRVDALSGMFGGLRRWIVERRVRGALEENLPATKRSLESSYRAAARRPGPPTAEARVYR